MKRNEVYSFEKIFHAKRQRKQDAIFTYALALRLCMKKNIEALISRKEAKESRRNTLL